MLQIRNSTTHAAPPIGIRADVALSAFVDGLRVGKVGVWEMGGEFVMYALRVSDDRITTSIRFRDARAADWQQLSTMRTFLTPEQLRSAHVTRATPLARPFLIINANPTTAASAFSDAIAAIG